MASLLSLGLVVWVFALRIISVSLVCVCYLAKWLATQAVSNDAYVEE